MTIQEAIKNGKRFKRPCFPRQNWMYIPKGCVQITRIDGVPYTLDITDLLADDWEVEEEKIELTRTQFFKACELIPSSFDLDTQVYLSKHVKKNLYPALVEELFRKLGNQLGFKS